MERFWLFITSLSPAILLVSIRLVPWFPGYAWIGIAAGIISFLGAYLVLVGRKKVGFHPITPQHVQDETDQIPTYLITFVFPFVFVSDTPSFYTLVAYGVFALFIMTLLFRTDVAVVNPALLLAGYHVYTVETVSGSVKVISRRRPIIKTTFNAHPISGSLYLSAEK